MNDWIAVFRTGKQTDSNGNERVWTEGDLDHIVNSYNPEQHEAPVVIGHPKDNAPAWGWVEALKRKGDTLFAKPKDLVSEFVEMLKKKMFKKRSISLYPDGTLRHIGFLGAMPPAVKGLPDIAFNDADTATTWEFNEPKKEVRSMKFFEWLKDLAKKDGVTLDDLPASFSEADVQAKVEAARKEERDKVAQKFAETQKKAADDLTARENALKGQELQAKKDGIKAFCEGLLKEGKLTPAVMKCGMGMQTFLEQIAAVETTIEFGEGNEKKKQTPLEFMKGLLSGLRKQIDFGEVAAADKDLPRSGSGKAGEKLEALIQEKMKADKTLTYGAAFAEVQEEHKDLVDEYISEIREEG